MAYNNVKVKERQTVTPSSQTKQLGIVSEVPMNEWNADVPYEKLNLVTYKNGTFIAKEASKGFPPLDTDGWEVVWMPLLNGVGIASTVTEYALGEADSSVPPQDGWSSDIPTPKAGKYLWTRVTITYTNGERVIFYAVGAAGSVSKTSELENDGDGTSPFATQKELVAETARAQAAEQTNARAVETERARAEAAEQANAKGIETNAKAISDETTRAKGVESGLANRVTAIETVIPPGASATDQLSTQSFVNSSINALAAFYITYNASGAAFPSKAALFGATTFYQGGKTRVPTQNDYAIVLADESKEKGVDGSYPTTRYSYQGGTYPAGQWDFQYIVNNTSLTQAQVDALNSGITAAGVAQIETNKSDIAALKTKNTEQDNAIKTAQSTADNAQSAAEAAQRTANSKYSKPSGGIPATDLAGDIPTSKITGLATVATSGDYNDLLHKPAAYSLPIATATVLGGVKSSTTGTDGTDYKVQVNADGTMKVNVPSPDLSGYAKLSDDNEFTGTNTFKEQIKVGGSILYTTVSENGVYHDGDEIGFDLNNNGLKLWSGGEDETSTTYKNGRITRNGNIDIALPSTSGTLALEKQITWANVKPSGGIVKTDLASSVQTSLNKADSAVLTSAQSLTDVQKRIARENIGAGTPYFLPAATADMRGGIQVGYTQNGNNYPLQLDRITGRAYVTIPAAQFDIDAAFLAAHPVKSLYWSDDPTSPATHGGTWEELPQGTFLEAAGSGGTAGQTGGSNSVTLKEENLPNMYGYLADYGEWLGLGQFPTADAWQKGTYISVNDIAQYGTDGRGWSVAYGNEAYPAGVSKGGGQAVDNRPAYCTTHIWRRVA